MKKLRTALICLIIGGLVLINAINYFKSVVSNVTISGNGQFGKYNKAEIVGQMNRIVAEIVSLEKTSGKIGPEGYKVYSAGETERFLELYKALTLRLHYLNDGNSAIDNSEWGGYRLSSEANKPYDPKQVDQAMAELEKNGLPRPFVADFRIYLLPYVIPDVSGLGGAGYTMLSAEPESEDLISNQLQVTLYHEIGHHVHFSFMPQETAEGKELWAKFLQIVGGSWHGAGGVNTKDWSNSSEETFAEDFRMLFGTSQPFFGDIALGDPRADSQRAKAEIRFMKGLAQVKVKTQYQSPWIPGDGLRFWQNQGLLITGAWGLLALGIFRLNGSAMPARHRTLGLSLSVYRG
ncbi:MAG: hypothetical protein ACM3X9_12385 [Bacillota bacterium]